MVSFTLLIACTTSDVTVQWLSSSVSHTKSIRFAVIILSSRASARPPYALSILTNALYYEHSIYSWHILFMDSLL